MRKKIMCGVFALLSAGCMSGMFLVHGVLKTVGCAFGFLFCLILSRLFYLFSQPY